MRTIWKFPLFLRDHQEIPTPKDAKLLCVQMQQGAPAIWAEVESNRPVQIRRVTMIGTGHEILGNPGEYLGTIQLNNGALVFHVYVSRPPGEF